MIELTQEYIKTFLHYDPTSGVMRRTHKRTWAGNIVACDTTPKSKTAYGYLQINIDKRPYVVHRLAFLYMTGRFPAADVDHINGDRSDNRWLNLREVDRQTNLRNSGVRSDNTSGHIGVSFAKDRNKWHAYIDVEVGQRVSLGHFDSFDDAVAARKEAEVEHRFHPNHGGRQAWVG